MSLHEDIVANLTGYSKAMYSTWFFYRPARILLDAGEGVSSAMENFVFAIERVFLSHGHYDHIGGLPGLLQSRRSARGDKEKPLEVYYPVTDELIALQRAYVESLTYHLGYELSWHSLEAGQRVELGEGRGYLVPMAVRHSGRGRALGFRLMEQRRRLRPQFANLSQEEIALMARERPREEFMESYEKTLLAYSGDAMALEAADVAEAEVLMHEATFLDPDDRDVPTHATAEEAIRVAVEARVAALVLFHISSRYPTREVVGRVRALAEKARIEAPIAVVRGGRKMWVWPDRRQIETRSQTRVVRDTTVE